MKLCMVAVPYDEPAAVHSAHRTRLVHPVTPLKCGGDQSVLPVEEGMLDQLMLLRKPVPAAVDQEA